MLYKLRDIIINYDMNDFLKSGKQALERNDFAAAYAIAVLLPDWCAADEYPDMKQVKCYTERAVDKHPKIW